MKKVKIYTDGSCLGNPGPGGWGAIICIDGKETEMSGNESETTNNKMELLGAICALRSLEDPCEVTLYSDSQYLCNGMNQGWAQKWKNNGWMRGKKKPALNPDLWDDLLALASYHSVTFVWVHGHADDAMNIRCDKLASDAAKEAKNNLSSKTN